ncbi:MAG: pyridoxamine 5'-phosphate oxidase family protein [Candidatus Methanomethylophilus sp.]|nr:pyridoxamine 5'-phosphate oxidase family protein [Methanomethylophilus sp.]MDD4668846.1 pyridoxamine 5'-phosphate oxidase family protein [Methanomethylophilus sp.]
MVVIPTNVMALLNAHDTVKLLITSSKDGQPHAIPAGSIAAPTADTVIIGEILTKQSVKNIAENKKAAFVVIKGMEAYEINVVAKEKVTSGPMLDGMNKAMAAMHLHANAVLTFAVESVYNQSASPAAGQKLA